MEIIQSSNGYKLPIDLQESVDSIIKKEGYKTYTITATANPTNADSFLAELFVVDVKGTTADGDKETNLFIKKIIPENFPLISVAECYERELFAYIDLFKVYYELQENANIPKHERFNTAKCYDESSSTAIILENLKRKGYKIFDREELLPLKFVELSIQQLARFHGLSLVLEKKRPEYFKEKVLRYRNIFKSNRENFVKFMHNSIDIILEHLDGEAKSKMETFTENMVEKYVKRLDDCTSTVCCVTHRDFRQCNIMMKEIGGEITKVITVDFQLIGYGIAIQDLIVFILLTSDRKFKKDHFDNLKYLYYESLRTFLNFFDIDVETIYPREEYEKVMREQLDYGLMAAFHYFPFMYVSKDDCVEVAKENLTDLYFKPSGFLIERMTGLIDDYTEWGYL